MPATQDLQRLVVSLEARIDKFDRAMSKATSITNRSASQIESRFDRMQKTVNKSADAVAGKFRNMFAGFGAGVLGALSIQRIAQAVGQAVKNVADLADAANDLGISSKALQTWNRVALETGRSTEEMSKVLAQMVEQARDSDSALSKLFARFGKRLTGNATQDLVSFMAILDKMPDQADKMGAILDVLGPKLGRVMTEALAQGGAKFQETFDGMQKRSEFFEDAQTKLARRIESNWNVSTDKMATQWEQFVLAGVKGWEDFSFEADIAIHKILNSWRMLEGLDFGGGVPTAPGGLGTLRPGGVSPLPGKAPPGGAGTVRMPIGKATSSEMDALRKAASELGTTVEDLATVISYETGGTMSPAIRGGKGNRHIGLIQFGPNEAAQFGANQGQTFAQQVPAAVRYLKARGFQPGMGISDLYSTINAGKPGLYGASDRPGMNVAAHVASMGQHRRNMQQWLQWGQPLNPMNGPPYLPGGHVGTPGYAQAPIAPNAGRAPVLPRDKPMTPDQKLYDQTETNITTLTRLYEEQQEQLQKTTDASNAYAEQLSSTVGSAVSGLVDDLLNGVEAGEALSNMFKRLASQLVDQAIQQIFSFGGAPGGLFGQLFGGGAAIPARADGGPVASGGAYVVGERGPEVFMPKMPGIVMPNGRSGGGDVNLAMTVTRSKEFEVEVRRIAGGFVPGTLKAARRGYPTTAARFQKLGTV